MYTRCIIHRCKMANMSSNSRSESIQFSTKSTCSSESRRVFLFCSRKQKTLYRRNHVNICYSQVFSSGIFLKLSSVCPSVCPICRSLQQPAGGLLLSARAQETDGQWRAHSSKCEQRHVYSHCRRLNTDLSSTLIQ